MKGKSRSDEIAEMMGKVPVAPSISDSYVAKLLAADAAKRTELSKQIGIQAYTVRMRLCV
jgi:hypothetical protein